MPRSCRAAATGVALACLLGATAARAHGLPPIQLTEPLGVGSVVTRGEPFTVRWSDPDLYADTWVTVMLRSEPPPPYIHDWPADEVEGVAVSERTPLTDPVNFVTIDTADLEAGDWFFWIAYEDETGLGKYVRPSGVLAVADPGTAPAPVVWFDEPSDTATSVDGTYTVVYSTFPQDGVAVTLAGSMNDLPGDDLEPRAVDLPGGAQQRHRIETIVCEEPGSFGIHAEVIDGQGRRGSAFAPGRVAWFGRDPGGAEPPACRRPSVRGGGCRAAGHRDAGPLPPLWGAVLLALAVRRRRSAAAVCQQTAPSGMHCHVPQQNEQ